MHEEKPFVVVRKRSASDTVTSANNKGTDPTHRYATAHGQGHKHKNKKNTTPLQATAARKPGCRNMQPAIHSPRMPRTTSALEPGNRSRCLWQQPQSRATKLPPSTSERRILRDHATGVIIPPPRAHTCLPPPPDLNPASAKEKSQWYVTYLEAEVNVLVDAEPKVAGVGEVARLQLVLLHLQAALQNLLRLVPADRHVRRDLLVTTNAERANRQPRLGEDRCLPGQLFEHTGGAGEAIARLTDAAVEDQLVHLQLPHRVGEVLLTAHHGEEVAGREPKGGVVTGATKPEDVTVGIQRVRDGQGGLTAVAVAQGG